MQQDMQYEEESYESDPFCDAESQNGTGYGTPPDHETLLSRTRGSGACCRRSKELDESRHRIEELEKHNAWLSARSRSYEEQIKEGEETNRTLLRDIEQLRSSKKWLESQVNTLETELTEVKAGLAESRNGCQLLRKQCDHVKDDLEVLQNDFAALSSDRELCKNELEKSSHSYGLLLKELHASKELLNETEAKFEISRSQFEEKESFYLKEIKDLRQEAKMLKDNSLANQSASSVESESIAAAFSPEEIKVHHYTPLIGQGEGCKDATSCTACEQLKLRLKKKSNGISDLKKQLEMLQVEKSIVLSKKDDEIEKLENDIKQLQELSALNAKHLARETNVPEGISTADEAGSDARVPGFGPPAIAADVGKASLESADDGIPTTADVCRHIVVELVNAVGLVCPAVGSREPNEEISRLREDAGGDRATVDQEPSEGGHASPDEDSFAALDVHDQNLRELLQGLRGGVNTIQNSVSAIVSFMETTASTGGSSAAAARPFAGGEAGPSRISFGGSTTCPLDVASDTSLHCSEPSFGSHVSLRPADAAAATTSLTLPAGRLREAGSRLQPEACGGIVRGSPVRGLAPGNSLAAFAEGTAWPTVKATGATDEVSLLSCQSQAGGKQNALQLRATEAPTTRSAFGVLLSAGGEADSHWWPFSSGERPAGDANRQRSECSVSSSAGPSIDACSAVLDERVQQIGSMFERRLEHFDADVKDQLNRIKHDLTAIGGKYDELLRPAQCQATTSAGHRAAIPSRYAANSAHTQRQWAQHQPRLRDHFANRLCNTVTGRVTSSEDHA